MKHTILLFFLCLATFISNAYASDFLSFTSYNKELSDSINDLKYIFNNYQFKNLIPFNIEWIFRDPGLTYDSYLLMHSFNLTKTKLDLTKFNGSFKNYVEVTTDGNQVFELNFEFKYIGRTTYFKKYTGSGIIKISDFQFNFIKRQITENSTFTALLLGLTITCDIDIGSSDNTLNTYFSKIKAEQLLKIKAQLIQEINTYIDYYYKSKIQDHLISFETVSPNFNYTYSFKFIQAPEYIKEKGVTYYFNGNLKRELKNRVLAEKLRSLNDDEYVFEPKDGDYQVYLPNSILRNVFTDFSTSKKITFILNDKTWIPEYKFLLNIDFLGKIIPAIYNEKARDEKISIKGAVTELDYDDELALLVCKINFQIYDSSLNLLFSWSTDVQFKFSPTVNLDESSINIIIKSVFITDITIIKNDHGATDIQILKGWIEDSFNILIAKSNFRLFKRNICLKKFIKIKQMKEIDKKGILLIG